jgi:hypothetical protein
MDAAEPSLSRLVLFREAMVAADDAATPVWATHYGWSADPAAGVDPSQQAAFLLAGIARARAEWPWLGPLFAWGLRPGPAVGGDVPAERALLGPNNAPTPQMVALAAAAAAGIDEAAATGFLPVDSRQIVYTAGDWRPQHLGPDAYRTTTEIGAELGVAFVGTGVTARLRVGPELGTVVATLDGEPIALPLEAFQAQDADVVIAEGLSPGMHRLTLRLGSEGELTLGGFFVERAIPLQWPMIVMLGSGVVLLLVGARSAIALVAERTGRLQRRRGVELWPELPQLPGWQPPRRA